MPDIRAAEFRDNGDILCFNGDGRKIAVRSEPSVRAFVEKELKSKKINETTKLYLPAMGSVEITTVAEVKKRLGMNSIWYKLRKLFG